MKDMTHLSVLDGAFLYLETPEMPMHVGSLAILTPPPGGAAAWYEAVKAHVASRMHLVPAFTRKLAPMPFDLANPVWIADDDIDLDYHIRRTVLPAPGTMAQIEALAARLHSSLLDRSRPLWEFYVIEGLADGRIGFYSKVHHAAVDGQAAVEIVKAVYDLSAEPRRVRSPRPRRGSRYQLGVAELLTAMIGNQIRQAVQVVRLLPPIGGAAWRGLKSVLSGGREGLGKALAGLRWRLAPPTPFNASITNQRAFAGVSLPLAEVKALGKARGASVNDMVLWLCSTALREYLAESRELPEASLVAGVPISLRAEGDATSNNQVSGALVDLGTQLADPVARLEAIMRATQAMKAQMGSLGALIPKDYPSLGSPWLLSGLVSLYGRSRLADRLRVSNVTISNVPGPQVPLYLAGAHLDAMYPLSIVVHGVALNITIQSYMGQLCFGLIACRRAVPDVRSLAESLERALQAMRELPPVAEAAAPALPEPAAAEKKPRRQPRLTVVEKAPPPKARGTRRKAAA
jgi:diacylglycerol O-acyltransferase